MRTRISCLSVLVATLLVAGCSDVDPLDQDLRDTLERHAVEPFEPGPKPPRAKVALGQALFFDKVLSGNRDTACATCHHPQLGSGDALAVSIGTGGSGLGPERDLGDERALIPRNAPEVFNRGSAVWTTMFWDSRVTMAADGHLRSPAGDGLPGGLDGVLAAQAMFPVTSADEMRGADGDLDVHGGLNELALLADDDQEAIWSALMVRVLSNPEYVRLFQKAYPNVAIEDLGFQHAANAIAAFEVDAFTCYDSPWERYVAGDDDAVSGDVKRGVLLYYGRAGCSSCHGGSLLTDQAHHNIAVPQIGPGKGAEAPLDLGRWRESGARDDRYAFRTPPLRNVATSGPWMHNGAYSTLEAAVRHHLDPVAALREYDPSEHLPRALRDTHRGDEAVLDDVLASLDPLMAEPPALSDAEVDHILSFLIALTDPIVLDMDDIIPASVPSGLPVDG